MYDVIVVGGGAAGMMAAGTAAMRGRKVALIEKNHRLGKKLYITGKGRCNVTNAADISEFFPQIFRNRNFMYSALYSFTNEDTMALFRELGVPLKVERGQRVFPESDRAGDIVGALKKYCQRHNVTMITDSVTRLVTENKRCKGVTLASNQTVLGESVILATGGVSYPLTGSTGDGYRLAEQAGHTVVAPKPALVPLELAEHYVKELQGLSLKNVSLKVIDSRKNKTVFEEFGEMLFTHFGVSGPLVISASSHIEDGADYQLLIDLKPALTEQQLEKRLLRDFEKNQNRDFKNSLGELLPQKMIPVVVAMSQISPQMKVNQITKEQRKHLIAILKGMSFTYTGKRPIEEAIITDGGVQVKEVNPSTMESKLLPHLYFAGEILDVCGYTGGFNLQIAFSTGHLAGENA